MMDFFQGYRADSGSNPQEEEALNALDLAAFNDPQEWEFYLQKGAFLYALGRYPEALQVAEVVLRLRPDTAEAFHAKGSALHGLGRYGEALECFEQAIALKPGLAMAYVGKAHALADMKEFESALQAIDTALELDPRLALAHADKGSLLIALGRDEDAVRSLDLALGLGLDEPVAEACYARKGRALASSGKYEQALAVYNQAIARYPHSIEFLIEKVAMLHALKRTKEAFAVLKEASKLDPQNALIPYTEGELYRTSRRYQSALAAYDRAIQYQPDFAAAYVGKGITLGETGEHGRAGVLFEYALKLDPQNIDARNHLSNVFLILQQPQKALEIDETAIQLNPNLAELHRKRGLALEDLERYPEALAAYEKAIELDPNVADTHHDKGVLLDKMDQPEAALEALNRALALNPRQFLSYHSKAIVLHRLSRYEEAIEACDAALKINPDFQPARIRKARIEADLLHIKQGVALPALKLSQMSQTTTSAGSRSIGVFPVPTKRARRRLKRRPVWIAALCVLLVVGLRILHSVLPAGAATLTLAPQSQDLNLPYTLTASNQTDLAHQQVRGRMLTYKTSTQSQSTSVQSTGFIPATSAHGYVVFSQVNVMTLLNSFDGIDLGNGLTLVVDTTTQLRPGNTYTVPAHIQQAGSKGNLPAHSIDGLYTFSGVLYVANSSGPTAFLSNPQPFTGGADAYNGPVVSQTDTDPLLSGLYTKNTEEAQQYFQSHLQPGEALLSNMVCKQHETDRPSIGSPGTSVTVSLFSTCQVEAYDQQGLNTALLADAHQQARNSLDPHFILLPPLQVTVTDPGTVGPSDSVSLTARSQWRLLLDKSGVQAVQRALVGLSQDDARDMLQNRFSCRVVSLNLTWWWGGHMPSAPGAIQIIVQ